jgi:hypothetical protein
MHWFDRVSKQLAEVPTESTRGSFLRGAAVAVAVAPFAPGALSYANTRLRRRDSNDDCLYCLNRAEANSKKRFTECRESTPKAGRALQLPKGGGKGGKGGKSKKGVKPSEAAKRAACMAKDSKRFLEETTSCVKLACAGFGETAPPPATGPNGGGTGCPSGTTFCSGTLCCYGSDNCCACALVSGGAICCASVIQCGCC